MNILHREIVYHAPVVHEMRLLGFFAGRFIKTLIPNFPIFEEFTTGIRNTTDVEARETTGVPIPGYFRLF